MFRNLSGQGCAVCAAKVEGLARDEAWAHVCKRCKQIETTPAKAELPPDRAQPKHTGKVYSVEHVSKSRATAEGPRKVRNGQRFFIAMGGSYDRSQSSTS
jgi:hypothetical protein